MASQPDQVRPASTNASAPPPPPVYPEGTSSDEIHQDIRRTRRDMDETVDQLEERLRPRHLIDDLLSMFRSSGGSDAMSGAKESFKDAGHTILEKLKQHPMPAALIGAGIVWMLFEDDGRARMRSYERGKWDVPEHSGSFVDARTGQPYDIETYGQGFGSTAPQSQVPSMAEQAKDKLSGAMEGVKEGARSVGQKVGEWTGAAREGTSAAADALRGYSSSAADRASRGYETGKHYLERGMDDYPLAMGAAAMALGVLSGLLLPRTRTEDRVMGDAADVVKDRAREAGREVVETGKDVARSASDEASRQGLHPGSIVDKAKRVVEDVADAAVESARREGLDPQSLSHKGQQVAERAKETATEDVGRKREQYPA